MCYYTNKGVFVDNTMHVLIISNECAIILYCRFHSVLFCDLPVCFTTSAGKAGEMIDRGDNTYGGKFVVNPSGGLISKGHPLGATGRPTL